MPQKKKYFDFFNKFFTFQLKQSGKETPVRHKRQHRSKTFSAINMVQTLCYNAKIHISNHIRNYDYSIFSASYNILTNEDEAIVLI